ncbi:hypothetical protein BTE77_35535 [Ensifer adhaerens]|nr:hypothetical protein BTE77_35535 [Ensifer adhaerens]
MVSPVSGIYAKVRQKFHLSPLFKFPEPALLCRATIWLRITRRTLVVALHSCRSSQISVGADGGGNLGPMNSARRELLTIQPTLNSTLTA